MAREMRNITVKASQINKAIAKAHKMHPHDSQASRLEVLLIPALYKRWQVLNMPRFKLPTITRIAGKPAPGIPDENRAIGARKGWAEYAGYVFNYGYNGGLTWNSVREDWYGHGPGCAWDGVRRETYSGFVDSLIACAYQATEKRECGYRLEEDLHAYQITFVNDLA